MKRYKYYITLLNLLTAILLLVACHDYALPDGQSVAIAETSATSYLNLHIVSTSTSDTRSSAAEENAVYDGILCIFEGNSEAEAQLKSATVIDQLVNNPGNNTSVNITQQLAIGTHPYSGKRYVLALLNTTSTGFSVRNGMLCHHGAVLTGSTIDDIKTIKIDSVGSTAEHVGLFMANAPQSDGTIMPQLSASYLFDTPEAATAGRQLTINVERAAARVTVSDETTVLRAIFLNGKSNIHPSIHKMTWTLNNFQQKSYVVRHAPSPYMNWAMSVADTPLSFSASDFSLWPHRSHSNDELYIAENTNATETEVIVEVQLKDQNSMLMHHAFVFHPFGEYTENAFTDLYTSPEQYIEYLKWGLSPENKMAFGLENKDNADIFKNATIIVEGDGDVVITLHNYDFGAEDQVRLTNLASFLSAYTTCFHDGKLYYTYKITHSISPDDSRNAVVRNNAYDLRLTDESIRHIGRNKP